MIDSHDGAENRKNGQKGKVDISSFNFQVFSNDTIEEDFSTSINILTWQQMAAKESKENVIVAMSEPFSEKLIFRNQNAENDIYCFEVHDAKTIYMMKQCSTWN